uniref:Uncharacterized protein n=1 Tax=Triticum urartu TaxID=4572 RepID=A0A8R7NZ18_TRIUA
MLARRKWCCRVQQKKLAAVPPIHAWKETLYEHKSHHPYIESPASKGVDEVTWAPARRVTGSARTQISPRWPELVRLDLAHYSGSSPLSLLPAKPSWTWMCGCACSL